jgi:hypothetical protein
MDLNREVGVWNNPLADIASEYYRNGFKQFFNTLDGQLETYRGHLNAKYWEVIRTSKEGKTMTKDFTGLKVGDKITRDNDQWSWWIKGKEYEVHANDTKLHTECDFYIVDEEDDDRWFNVDQNGKLTNGEVQANFSWNKPENVVQENTMKFKVGEKYKSNQSGVVYKYIGKHSECGYLNFEIVSGGSVGALIELNISYAELVLELQVDDGEEATEEVPVFVKANITELLEAINNGEQDQYYIYNPKKGTMVSVAWETNLHQLIVHQILRKVDK